MSLHFYTIAIASPGAKRYVEMRWESAMCTATNCSKNDALERSCEGEDPDIEIRMCKVEGNVLARLKPRPVCSTAHSVRDR